MRKIAYSFLTLLVSLAMAGPVVAQGDFSRQAPNTTFRQNTMLDHGNTNEISNQTKEQMDTGVARTDSAENLIGLPVVAKNGNEVGKIKDLKVDPATGKIDYVIVNRKSLSGENLYTPVPLGALQISNHDARLAVDESTLDNAPNPGNKSDEEFRQDLDAHYGVAPTWEVQRKTTIHEEKRTVTP